MPQEYYILMADIRHSRRRDADVLMTGFKQLVAEVNRHFKNRLASKMSISLGDECQTLFDDLKTGIECILFMEECIIRNGLDLEFRYVLNYGLIDSTIEGSASHQLLGTGLIESRDMLQMLKRKSSRRFSIECKDDYLNGYLKNTFTIFRGIKRNWKFVDYPLIAAFLKCKDYKEVAKELGKDSSLMWRREKSLRMKSYFALKDLIINSPIGKRN